MRGEGERAGRTIVFASYIAQDNLGDEITDRYFLDLIGDAAPRAEVLLLNLANGTPDGGSLDEWFYGFMQQANALRGTGWFDFRSSGGAAPDILFLANTSLPREILHGLLTYAKHREGMLTVGGQLKDPPGRSNNLVDVLDLVNLRDPMVAEAYRPMLGPEAPVTEFDPVAAWHLNQAKDGPRPAADVDVLFSVREGLDEDGQAKAIERFIETEKVGSFALYASSLSDARAIARHSGLKALLGHPRQVARDGDAFLGSPRQVGLSAKVAAIRAAGRVASLGRLHSALIAVMEGKPTAFMIPARRPGRSGDADGAPFHKTDIFPRLGIPIQSLSEAALRFAAPDMAEYAARTREECARFERAFRDMVGRTASLADAGKPPLPLPVALRRLKSTPIAPGAEPLIAERLDEVFVACLEVSGIAPMPQSRHDANGMLDGLARMVAAFSSRADEFRLSDKPWEREAEEHGTYAASRLREVSPPAMFGSAQKHPDAHRPGGPDYERYLLEVAVNFAGICERAAQHLSGAAG